MTIIPPSKWVQYILARQNNRKKVLGRVKLDSVDKFAEELREQFGIDPKDTPETAITDWAIALEENNHNDFEPLGYHAGHDLSGLTPTELLDFVHTGKMPPHKIRGRK